MAESLSTFDPSKHPVWALLEFKTNPHAKAMHFCFNVEKRITATHFSSIPTALQEAQALANRGYSVCGYISYDAGYYCVDKPLSPRMATKVPLVEFIAFRSCLKLDEQQTQAMLTKLNGAHGKSAIYQARLNKSKARYLDSLKQIQQYIVEGDVYQVNYTLKYQFNFAGSIAGLYSNLRKRQSVDYSALLYFPNRNILSLSPECFLSKQGSELVAQPMKGTAARGVTPDEDQKIIETLSHDTKTLSEHLMIVDLMRNDIGRLADVGTVQAKNLFEIKTFETLHQMVSTIYGKVDPDIALSTVIHNLFPCGSITGAPKMRAMEIINALEKTPRGIYTGAIGYLMPKNDFCFNVAIRTIVTDKNNHAEMGIGSGIVHDADPDLEYHECLLKATFLTHMNETFQLIESFLYRSGATPLLRQHLERLQQSAAYFGFAYERTTITQAITAFCKKLDLTKAYKIRLFLSLKGDTKLSAEVVEPLQHNDNPIVTLSSHKVDSTSIWQRHKTTHRSLYDKEHRAAQANNYYDVLFCNERGEVAEASRHNVFILKNEKLYTPPITSGALPGVMRASLLSHYPAHEAKVTIEDLTSCNALYLTNSIRGMLPVRFEG